MREFTYVVPTEIVFGADKEKEAGRLVKKYGGSRVLVVYGGGSVIRSGLLDRVTASLGEAGVEYAAFGGAQPNPVLSRVKEGVAAAMALGADMILAVGGGSAIDTGKAIAIGAANPEGELWDFWAMTRPVVKALPTGVVLTIPAAGSETSTASVITNEETLEKRGLNVPQNRPVFSILNPSLAATLPRWQAACGVADIFMHTVDRYFSPYVGNELTDELAEAVLRTVVRFGPRVCADPADYEAMSEIMWTGSVSHNDLTGLGSVRGFTAHALAHELSGQFDVTHGAAVALSHVWLARYAWRQDPNRYARLARNVWGVTGGTEEEQALACLRCTEEFFRSLGLPMNVPAFLGRELTGEEIELLADRCTDRGRKVLRNRQELTRADAVEIYRSMNGKI